MFRVIAIRVLVTSLLVGCAGEGVCQGHRPFTPIADGLPSMTRPSASWGDYDNDGDLDVLLLGEIDDSGSNPTGGTWVFRNDDGSFVNAMAGLMPMYSGSAAWGDYNRDDALDILVTGQKNQINPNGTFAYGAIYFNAGSSFINIRQVHGGPFATGTWADYNNDGDLDAFVTHWEYAWFYDNQPGSFFSRSSSLPSVSRGSVAWGDFDNDRDLDVLLTGSSASSPSTRLFRNDNGGVFAEVGVPCPDLWESDAVWGDYDNDGDLDFLITGWGQGFGSVTQVFRNDGGSFVWARLNLTDLQRSAAAWGDYDNDGDLDVMIAGDLAPSPSPRFLLYRNDGGSFTEVVTGINGLTHPSLAWGDFDADGDLDILLSGETAAGRVTEIHSNNAATPNTPPSAPTNLRSVIGSNSVTFSWDAAEDAETPTPGLTYNIRVGTTPGGGELCSGMADPVTGRRRIAAMGNANHNLSWSLVVPGPLTTELYWAVQAIDTSFEGSPWAVAPIATAGPPHRAKLISVDCSPNPFNAATTIRMDLPESGHTSVSIHDLAGRLVTRVFESWMDAGEQEVGWNGRDHRGQAVTSGVYICRVTSGGVSASARMTIVK